ncbi:inorganic diphosphatase [Buchnera aphidicola (Taiwanaphis decaspermi)]|uniref:inorganic diphosphatase n=1 Tax=Buchnera aphidicola TaxID=9 RepID=UPI0031B835A3
MHLKKIPIGKKIPDSVYAIIEISSNSYPIKYEMDKTNNSIFVDRIIPTSMFYPCNYGFINKTLSLDGDPLDILVPTQYPLHIGTVILCRPIGVLKMTDESGVDLKIIAVPDKSVTKEFNFIHDIQDISLILKNKITHFFKNYKKLEKNKWVKIDSWGSKEEAKQEILQSIKRYKKK